jgi:hypothetical protein
MLLPFSGYIRERSAVTEAYAERFGGGACTLEVIGGESNAMEEILSMMKWWGDGVKTVPEYPAETIFCDLYHLSEAALVLKVPSAMVQVIDDRLISASSNLVPGINDMIKIYEDFPADHYALWEVVGIWAHAHVNGTIPLHGSAPAVLSEDLAQDLEASVNSRRDHFGLEEIMAV